MGKLIYIIGLDGSGKTTMARAISQRLQELNIPCRIVWAKFGLTTYALFRMKLAKHFGISKFDQNNVHPPINPSNPYLPNLQSALGTRIYLRYLLFEHWIRLMFNIKVPIMLGHTVICDRCYIDTIVDLIVTFGYSYEDATKVVKSMPWLPKPDNVFYIEVSPEKAFERKQDKYNISYLKKRYEVYRSLERDLGISIVDGNLSVENLKIEMLKQIL